ncbi:MAG: ribonuclease BN [Candidatus Rokuibacteriota bacterium]|nr:MAG: ribonuclease BN [Candidatus Rokubacteria bacterium]
MRVSERQREDTRPEALRPQPERDEHELSEPTTSGRGKLDYLAILRRSVGRAREDNITNLAAALAYYAFLAIPSALLVAAGLFGLLAGPNAVSTVVDKLHGLVPAQALTLLRGNLIHLTEHRTTGLAVLVVGGLLALWALSGAMQNLMWALNAVYGREESRGFVRRRASAFAMVFFALLGFGLLFGLLVLGPQLSTWVGNSIGARPVVKTAWWIAEWPLLVVGLLLALAAIFRLGPNVRHPRWSFVSFGAVFALVVWLAASGAFAFYVSRFGSYNKAWGSLAAVVIMLTWLWLSAVALLFGAEINAESERSREQRSG